MTTTKKSFGSLCLAVGLLACLLCADAALATILNVQMCYQEQDQWCWAATSQAILEYYGVIETQTEIADYGTPGTPDTWNYLYGTETDPTQPERNGVDLILDHFAGLTTTRYTHSLVQTAVSKQINILRPIAIRWLWNGTTSGHILAIRGIAGNNVYLMDPWNGDAEIASYNWVVSSGGAGGHTWTHSLTIGNAPAQSIPIIDTPVSYSITSAGATTGATIESPGAALPTASGVAYGINAYPTVNGTKVSTVPTVTSGAFVVNLRGLTSNTIYHYRGYATNAAGPAYTVDSTFTTLPGAPKAAAATAVTSSGFIAHWKAPSGNAPILSYDLQVATDPGFEDVIENYAVSGLSLTVTVPSKGKYYYRVRAENAGGTGAYSGTIAVNVR
jgi:hypothetical protein